MSFSPEIGKIPHICRVFARAGLVDDLIFDVIRGRTRNLIFDAERLSKEFDKNLLVRVCGIENISASNGSLTVFNHPNIDILLPALLELMIAINTDKRKNTVFVMGSEIPLFGRLNKYPLPGSPTFLKRFHHMYPDNIISVPTAQVRKDYLAGRHLAARHVVESLMKGNIVIISPEGHVEIGNQISPVETFNAGSGQLAIIATKHHIPINPVAIWEEKGAINVEIGGPFNTETDDKIEAVNDLMRHVANILPNRLRGPFREKQMEKVSV